MTVKYIKLSRLLLLMMIFSCTLSTAFAQQAQQVREDFTDDELEAFVDANEKVIEIQQESQEKIKEAIEEEGLTIEKFNEIVESQRNPNIEVNATQQELVSFNNAAQVIIKENQETQTEIISSIEDEGIDITTYQEIMIAYQQVPKVKEKVNKLLEDRE